LLEICFLTRKNDTFPHKKFDFSRSFCGGEQAEEEEPEEQRDIPQVSGGGEQQWGRVQGSQLAL
jgi:hypothetical protein